MIITIASIWSYDTLICRPGLLCAVSEAMYPEKRPVAGGQGQRVEGLPGNALSLGEVEAALAGRGLRFTVQRRAITGALIGAARCLSATEVYDLARESCPRLGLMTVYRTLEVLAEAGLVRRVHGAQSCDTYAAIGARHGHTVVCTGCGRVCEFTQCDLDRVAAAAEGETGFRIQGHFLQFSGLCRECQEGREATS